METAKRTGATVSGPIPLPTKKEIVKMCIRDSCQAEAEAVAAELKRRYGVKEVYINYIGPVIGSHTGPDTMRCV